MLIPMKIFKLLTERRGHKSTNFESSPLCLPFAFIIHPVTHVIGKDLMNFCLSSVGLLSVTFFPTYKPPNYLFHPTPVSPIIYMDIILWALGAILRGVGPTLIPHIRWLCLSMHINLGSNSFRSDGGSSFITDWRLCPFRDIQ